MIRKSAIIGLAFAIVASAPLMAGSFKTPPQTIQMKVVDFTVTPSVTFQSNPTSVAGIQAKQLFDEKSVLIIDARSTATYRYAHIPGAKLATIAEPDSLKWLETLSKSTPCLVYCGSKTCKMSSKLSKYMIDLGFKKIYLFEGGYAEWDAQGFPVEGDRNAGNKVN